MKPPKYLYRYCSFPKIENKDKLNRLKEMFINNHFYAVCPLWFNDPFDCKVTLSAREMNSHWWEQLAEITLKEDTKQNSDELSKRIHDLASYYEKIGGVEFLKTMRQSFLKLLENMAIFCLSEVFDNILMWSHYADSHKGFCLQFDTEHIMGEWGLIKVEYVKDYAPLTTFIEAWHFDKRKRNELILSRKSQCWNYEQEWRLIFIAKKGEDQIRKEPIKMFPEKALSGVILGSEISDDNRVLIKQWNAGRTSPLQVFEAQKSIEEYAVIINGLSNVAIPRTF